MNAVIYARYSSDSQREESIEGQLRECREYAERNNMTIVGTYIDRALSAKTADRPEFQHMIKDSAKELFEIVLVWKLDRFSRDRYDSAHYKHILKKNGVKVVSAKEHISEGPEGIILEAMLEGYAEFYSAELSEKIHRGQKENALKGKNNGGGVPLGYLLDKKAQKLVIDPVTAPLVVEVFEKYADGKSVRSIVEDFNARGLKTKRGQPFNINSFSSLLKNRKYIGEYRYQDVVIEGGVPAIVPEDLFNRVQERMEKNRHAPAMAKAKEDYLLTTKLFCGKCERMMVGESGKSHTGAMHYYYKCSGAKRLKDCDKKAVRKDWIERVVVRLTMQRVMDEEKINRLIDAILVMQEQEDTTTPALRSQLAETESSIGNILKAIEQGIFTPSTKQRLDELEARKEEILVNIQTAELQKPKLTREQMTAWFEQFRHGDPANREFQKRLIDTFVNAVYVFDDKLVLTYNYQHGTQTISLDEIESALSSDFDGATPPKREDTLLRVFSFWRSAVCAADRTPFFIRVHTPLGLDSPLRLSQLPDVLQHAFAEAGDAGGELLAGVQAHAELAADAGADRQGLDARELAADHHLRHHRDAEPFADHADDGLVVHIAGADDGLDAVFPERRADVDIEPAVGHQKFLARKGLDGEKVPPVCRIVRGEDGVHRVVVQRRPVTGEAALPGGKDHVRLPFFQQLKRLELMVDRPQVHVDMRADAAEAV